MRLVRYGKAGREVPALLDADDRLREARRQRALTRRETASCRHD